MANKSVTVLTPNGRRPNLKISSDTTILQILEEACKKQNFNSEEYDLKYYNRILDVNATVRYANVPNNACLEMVKCKNPRKVSDVTICIHVEDETKHTGVFPPTTTIDKILKDLNIVYSIETVYIKYVHAEISGKEFESLTLRSLGIGSGSALLRLRHRTSEKQAYVYVPSQPKVSKTEEDEENRKRSNANRFKSNNLDPLSVIKAEKQQSQSKVCEEKECETKTEASSIFSNENENKVDQEPVSLMEVDESKPTEEESKIAEEESKIAEEEVFEEPQVEFLGERNALLFNQAGATAARQDDIPDSFFELTVRDAQTLLRINAKKYQSVLEDTPFMTSALRGLEKDKDKLYRLHKYQQTIIRIQFPNQLVLQGLFKPLETVENVKDFVKTYLEESELDFVLYTAPPRCDLKTEERLFDLDLVPSAIVYYSGKSDLKPEIKSRLTDPTAASYHAIKTRVTSMRDDRGLLDEEPGTSNSTLPGPSTSASSSTSNGVAAPRAGPSRSSGQKSQVPKWFKLSKK